MTEAVIDSSGFGSRRKLLSTNLDVEQFKALPSLRLRVGVGVLIGVAECGCVVIRANRRRLAGRVELAVGARLVTVVRLELAYDLGRLHLLHLLVPRAFDQALPLHPAGQLVRTSEQVNSDRRRISSNPYRDPVEFVDRVRREALLAGDTEASFAVKAAATVLRRHVSAGEIEDVARTFPDSLRALITD